MASFLCLDYFSGSSRSSLKDFNNETTISSMTTVNGRAAIIDARCNASSPPVQRSNAAEADWIIPQTNFTRFGGLRLPFVVCIPSTNVAESADVIKKVLIRKIASNENTVENGKFSSTVNSATSLPLVLMTSIIALFLKYSHPSTKEHRKPCQIAKIRAVTVFTKPDVSVFRKN